MPITFIDALRLSRQEPGIPKTFLLKTLVETPFHAFGSSPFMRFLDPHAQWVARTSGRIWKAMQRGEAREEMEEFTQDLARFYADKESDNAGTKPTPEARKARIKELDREFRQRFIPATAPSSKTAPAPASVPATTPATHKTTATEDATASYSAPDDYERSSRMSRLIGDGRATVLMKNQRALDLSRNEVRRLQGRVGYEMQQKELAERRAQLKHYGMVAGGALAGGAGAGLLSYLLAPKMSGLGRALTMVGGAAAGGAAAHYGSELANDWIASR